MNVELKEHYEHISVIMEIAAFFFVTLDLYGKENLNKLHINLKKSKEPSFNPTITMLLIGVWIVLVILNYFWFVKNGIIRDDLIVSYSILYFLGALIATIPIVVIV